MRHDNFCDRLILRMTCGSKSKEPSVSDAHKLKAIKRAEGGATIADIQTTAATEQLLPLNPPIPIRVYC